MRSGAYDPWPDSQVATMEIGYKDTGQEDCDNAQNFISIGFPSSALVQVDYQEDTTDAVLWFGSLNTMRLFQNANPASNFYASWKCDSDSDFRSFPLGEIGPFQVQLGYSLYAPQSPAYTFSDATFDMIPAEQAHKGVPSPGVTTPIHLVFDSPWPRDWSFEANSVSQWTASNSSIVNYCCGYDASQGGGYLYLSPQSSTATWVGQTFRIRGSGGSSGQLYLGSNTDYTLDIDFRCPTWSPSASGKSTPYCNVGVWLKTASHPSWTGQGHSWNIPNDGQWHHVRSTAWGAQVSDDDIQMWIDTRGYHLDIDGVWVSSGL